MAEEEVVFESRIFLWRRRDAARAMLGSELLTSCWRVHLEKISFEGYLICWEFILRYQGKHPAKEPAEAIASIMLDAITVDGVTIASRFADFPAVWNLILNSGTSAGGINPYWAILRTHISEMTNPAYPIQQLKTAMEGWPASPSVTDVQGAQEQFLKFLRYTGAEMQHLLMQITRRRPSVFFLAGVIAICHRGQITSSALNRVCGGFLPDFDVGSTASSETLRDVYHIVKHRFPADQDVREFFTTMKKIYTPEIHLRMSLEWQQAKNAGCASVVLGLTAINSSKDCPVWNFIRNSVPGEFNAFYEACKALKQNPYIGFDLGRASAPVMNASNYPAMVFAAITMLMMLDPESTARGYRGTPSTHLKTQIARIINAWVQAKAAAAASADAEVYDFDANWEDGVLQAHSQEE